MKVNTGDWHGIITNKNIEEVANAILSMLKGKKYTWTESYEYRGFRPETHLDDNWCW